MYIFFIVLQYLLACSNSSSVILYGIIVYCIYNRKSISLSILYKHIYRSEDVRRTDEWMCSGTARLDWGFVRVTLMLTRLSPLRSSANQKTLICAQSRPIQIFLIYHNLRTTFCLYKSEYEIWRWSIENVITTKTLTGITINNVFCVYSRLCMQMVSSKAGQCEWSDRHTKYEFPTIREHLFTLCTQPFIYMHPLTVEIHSAQGAHITAQHTRMNAHTHQYTCKYAMGCRVHTDVSLICFARICEQMGRNIDCINAFRCFLSFPACCQRVGQSWYPVSYWQP